MSSSSFVVTTSPSELTGLTDGMDYAIQNNLNNVLRVCCLPQADSAPLVGDARVATYGRGEWFVIQKRSGSRCWIWISGSSENGTIALQEMADD